MSYFHYPYSDINLLPGDKLVIKDSYKGILSINDYKKMSYTKYDHEYNCEVFENENGYIVRFIDIKTKKQVCDHHLYNVELDIYKGNYTVISISRKQQTELIFN